VGIGCSLEQEPAQDGVGHVAGVLIDNLQRGKRLLPNAFKLIGGKSRMDQEVGDQIKCEVLMVRKNT